MHINKYNKDSAIHVNSVHVEKKVIPLIKPYDLAYKTLRQFDGLLLYITFSNGHTCTGEVIPLEGYTEETLESVYGKMKSWLPNLKGRPLNLLRDEITNEIEEFPCASSLILSALDYSYLLNSNENQHRVPLVYPISSITPDLYGTVQHALSEGFRTFKVKIGQNFIKDIEALNDFSALKTAGLKWRFDANQAYTLKQALQFAAQLEFKLDESVELLEQPFRVKHWQEMAELAAKTSIPLMLDESIYTDNDIKKAASIGCQWIKLKLCKQGCYQELVKRAKYAKQCRLNVALGNGVASDISNFVELCAYAENSFLFDGASESNGYLKISTYYGQRRLRLIKGYAVF